MRLLFTLFPFLLISGALTSQDLTGIWRGYFSSSNGIYREGMQTEMYKYELQIEQQSNNGLKGITYSYKSTVFYGKAAVTGIVNLSSRSLILKETRLVDLKISDRSEPCLMTCYLDYTRMGKLEVLEGTFISVNVKDKGDCGNGKVYLERVANSDFKTEEFLLKRLPEPVTKLKPSEEKKEISKPPSKTATARVPASGNYKSPQSNRANNPATKDKTAKPAIAKNKPSVKSANKESVTSGIIPETKKEETIQNSGSERESTQSRDQEEIIKKLPVPRVIRERENNLVKTILTAEENIRIDLYDNGTIDNDSISVYDNNELVISEGRLSYTPITVNIKNNRIRNHHEIVVVAENLGEIPPNTALMVITAGKERYEIFLASNEKRNAKVVIEYKPRQ